MLDYCMRRIFLFLSLAMSAGNLSAQNTVGKIYFQDINPPVVTANNKVMSLAWSGGDDNPQFAMADLNHDGIKDLVIYEPFNNYRTKALKTFINTSPIPGNPKYVYNPNYAATFPEVIKDYLKLEDYNRDGIPDLFHRGEGGVAVYKGYYNSQNQLSFAYFKELKYPIKTGLTNVLVQPLDIPCIIDIDGDTDLDVMTFDQGGIQIAFYRNCQEEDKLPKDDIKMCLKDNCWGHMAHWSDRTMELNWNCSSLGTTCKTSGGEEKTTHSGNALTILDFDGDKDYDIFVGNVSFPEIQYARNGRTELGLTQDSLVWQDTLWGSANGKVLSMQLMPMCAWIDIDNDKDKDLVFSPRIENTENYRCIVYYKNEGDDSKPKFRYVTDTFLISEMIDVGIAAMPVFYDYNRDGKPDLFIGGEGYYQPDGSIRAGISYFENESSSSGLKFDLKTNDFLNKFGDRTRGLALSMGDLDGDFNDDLVIGKADGTIEYYRNYAANSSIPPNWRYNIILNDQFGTLDVGDFAAPFIYDINKDGKKDIICGNQAGRLYYYKNLGLGSGGNPTFKLMTDTLGGVKVADAGAVYSYATPFIGKVDNTNKDYLIIGSKNGTIYRYDSITNINKFVRIDSNFSYIHALDRSAPAVADLDNDGKCEMVVGTGTGGVYFYKQYFNSGVESSVLNRSDINVYPNPAKDVINITWEPGFASGDVVLSLVSVTGIKVYSTTLPASNGTAVINTSSYAQGMYYCILSSGDNKAAAPVSIVK